MLLRVILPTAIVAFGLGCLEHKDRLVLGLGALGLFGLWTPALVPHEWLGESGERIVTLGASGLLIAAHVRNFRCCRASRREHAPA